MPIKLVEICDDEYDAMICGGYKRIMTFSDRSAFEASGFETEISGPFRATEYSENDGCDNFEIWADDPLYHTLEK